MSDFGKWSLVSRRVLTLWSLYGAPCHSILKLAWPVPENNALLSTLSGSESGIKHCLCRQIREISQNFFSPSISCHNHISPPKWKIWGNGTAFCQASRALKKSTSGKQREIEMRSLDCYRLTLQIRMTNICLQINTWFSYICIIKVQLRATSTI